MKIKIAALFLILSACASQNPFTDISEAANPDYGYTPDDPILIKTGTLEKSINSSYHYLSRLRTENGKSLEVISRFSVDNPNFKDTGLTNRYSGQVIGGGGMFLDKYILLPQGNSTDTIVLFINPYVKGEIKIPEGLKFQTE